MLFPLLVTDLQIWECYCYFVILKQCVYYINEHVSYRECYTNIVFGSLSIHFDDNYVRKSLFIVLLVYCVKLPESVVYGQTDEAL